MTTRLLRLGESAVLIEVADAREVLVAADRLRRLPGVTEGRLEVVPAARTVMVRAEDPADLAVVAACVEDRLLVEAEPAGGPVSHDAPGPARGPGGHPGAGPRPDADVLVVPVRYDGPDLEEVARLTGLGEDGVVLAHTGV